MRGWEKNTSQLDGFWSGSSLGYQFERKKKTWWVQETRVAVSDPCVFCCQCSPATPPHPTFWLAGFIELLLSKNNFPRRLYLWCCYYSRVVTPHHQPTSYNAFYFAGYEKPGRCRVASRGESIPFPAALVGRFVATWFHNHLIITMRL